MPPRGKRGRTSESGEEVVVILGEGGGVRDGSGERGGSQLIASIPSPRGS